MVGEYIERERVLEILHNIGGCDADDAWADGWDQAINEAYRAVELVPAADVAPQWIKAYDKLPEIGQLVIVIGSSLSHPTITVGTYKGDYFGDDEWEVYFRGGCFRQFNLPYWMPPPELPRSIRPNYFSPIKGDKQLRSLYYKEDGG